MNEKFYGKQPGSAYVEGRDCGCERDRDRERDHGCERGRDRVGERRDGGDCGCERGGEHGKERNHERDDRTKLLKKIQQYNFMMIEAGLFLNNQPCCEAAKEAFCQYQKLHAEAKAEYEACYGPLTYEGINVKGDGWSWINGPWPWEVEDC